MYSTIDPTVFNKPGDFKLTDILLVSYNSVDGTNNPKKISIRKIVSELNIFESIFNKTLSGSLVVTDANNILANFPITGYERLEFKLRTPSINREFDFTEESGHPVYIYKVTDVQGFNPRAQVYQLHFVSKEAITNEQVKVNTVYHQPTTNIVTDIVRNPNFLDSYKDIYVEKSLGVHKYILPTISPFDAIDILGRETRSKNYDNSGFYFFETSYGFQYRSLESMLAISTSVARPSVASFSATPANIRNSDGQKNIAREMQVIQEHTITSQFDTLKNLRNGVFASNLTTIDGLNKTISVYNFNYNDQYIKNFHTEHGVDGSKPINKSILPIINYKNGKIFSEFYQGTRYLKSTTDGTYMNVERIPLEDILQKRLSQRLAFETFRLEIQVHGFTGLSAGDIVTVSLPSYAVSDPKDRLDRNPTASGRYLVASVRHAVSQLTKKHIMYLECIKDSINVSYADELKDTFSFKESDDSGIVNIEQLDDTIITNNSNIFN
jgi:hypothetical protein